MSEVQMCSQVPGEVATLRFQWAWGEEGFCSERGKTLLRQQAENLGRDVQFSALGNVAEPPMQRSERQGLIAAKLAAESEAEEVQRRASKLYDSNVELSRDLMSQRSRIEHLSAVNKDLNEKNAKLEAEVVALPTREDVMIPVEEQLIVELCSQ